MKHRIGSRAFKTKKEITEHVQHLFDKYANVGDIVDDDDDHQFLLALLERHTEHESKVGVGISYFSRDAHPKWKSPGFRLHRTDGSQTDFSTQHCISAKSPTLAARFSEACKLAVDDVVMAAKFQLFDAGNGSVRCPDSGKLIDKDTCRMEHRNPTWRELVEEFKLSIGRAITEDDVTPSMDNQYHHELTDPEMLSAFRKHHQSRMHLVPRRIERRRRER